MSLFAAIGLLFFSGSKGKAISLKEKNIKCYQ